MKRPARPRAAARTIVKPNPVKPLSVLSRGALEALVKLFYAGRSGSSHGTLIPSVGGARYYDELREAGYAYLSFNGYALNGDHIADGAISAALGLGTRMS